MKNAFRTSLSILAIMLAIRSNLPAQYNEKNLKLETAQSIPAYTYKNLQFYPVRANDGFRAYHQNLGKYLTLKEALEQKKVVITEFADTLARRQNELNHSRANRPLIDTIREQRSTATIQQAQSLQLNSLEPSGRVNTLWIENTSADTIMILAGEVVKGGKQDRMIAQDVLLAPQSGKLDLSVFCVEHHRWSTQSTGTAQFQSYFTISSNTVRKAATVDKNQSKVWEEVAQKVNKNKAATSTGTLAALDSSKAYTSELKAYQEFYASKLVNEGDVIGLIAVSGDKILGCDLFASHELFGSHYTNLVNSYASEALTNGSKPEISYNKVGEYLNNLLRDEAVQEQKVKENGTILKKGAYKLHLNTY